MEKLDIYDLTHLWYDIEIYQTKDIIYYLYWKLYLKLKINCL